MIRVGDTVKIIKINIKTKDLNTLKNMDEATKKLGEVVYISDDQQDYVVKIDGIIPYPACAASNYPDCFYLYKNEIELVDYMVIE